MYPAHYYCHNHHRCSANHQAFGWHMNTHSWPRTFFPGLPHPGHSVTFRYVMRNYSTPRYCWFMPPQPMWLLNQKQMQYMQELFLWCVREKKRRQQEEQYYAEEQYHRAGNRQERHHHQQTTRRAIPLSLRSMVNDFPDPDIRRLAIEYVENHDVPEELYEIANDGR